MRRCSQARRAGRRLAEGESSTRCLVGTSWRRAANGHGQVGEETGDRYRVR